ncbi:kinesin-like protein KIN-14T [Cornus florida]|uniref:kinesin-like protein KIN-14T n=1 Tax=Cornus florida TaxID=4283 RepID=UPI0028A23B29|nr:kinesin-like protein KIN-14T [Cornus florida]
MAMDSRRSVGRLAESIQSLLGLKKHHTPSWADSVCSIIKSLPSERPSEDNKNDNKDANLGKAIFKIKDELDNLTTNIYQLNIQRRQVLNDFLDLKGNIRVFCRLRPFMIGENLENPRVVAALDSNGVLLKFAEKKSKLYNFDRVFHPSSSQDDIFEEVEPVIKSALDGYNACIFAYGQTGTGKTFTMEGTPDCPGLVPRAIEALFKQASDSNHTFLFNFSMIEIYRGHLKDLLIPRTTRVTDPMPPCLSIHTDTKGEIEIDNLVTIQVNDYNQAIKIYRLGCRFRSTASTNSNISSSRSHCMIRMSMTCFDATERRRETNKLWMVDLGGSERILKTKACGRRLEEGKAINLSLSALGDVINALQSKKFHIPYRNSKLTQVLKDSIGEDSKTLMLVHVSPKEEDLCETVCTLNFATRVRSIHQGNEESTEARAQEEVAMTNLQQKMKQIENKRHEVGREIKKLKEKLENLLRTPPPSTDQLEDTHLSSQVPQLNIEPVEKIGNVAAAPSSELPRFMRSTICSRRKSGIDHIPLKKTDLVPERRRSTSQHAESVTFPIKDLSEYNSDSSISRTSCFVGLNLKCTADNETANSQDTSECDVKMVIFPEQGQSLRNSNHQTAKLVYCEGHGNSFPKFLKVKDWLQSHKNTPSIRSQNHQSKRILAIPTPKKKNKDNGQRTEEKLPDDKLYDYQITKRKIMFDKFNKHADEETAGRLISETVTDITPKVLKDFVHEDSRSNSIFQSCKSDGIIMMQARSVAEDMLIEDKKCSASTPPDKWCGRLNKKENDNGVNEIPMQEITCETQCLEAFMLTKSWGCSSYTSDINRSLIRSTEDLNVPVSGSELISQCQMVPNEVGKNSEDEDLNVSAQPSEAGTTSCLYKLRSHRGLLIDTANEEDLTMPFTKLQENGQHTGIYDLLKQKIQIFCISALLGLGFQSFFGDDFFYALML